MKEKCPSPVTNENFPLVWEYVDQGRRTARKKAALGRFSAFFGHLALAAAVLFFANGLIFRFFQGSYCDMLGSFEPFVKAWTWFSDRILGDIASWQLQVPVCLAVAYAAAMVVFCVFTLPVLALYHPLRKKLPTETAVENGALLVENIREARRFAGRTTGISSTFCVFIFAIGVFGLMSVYFLYVGDLSAAMMAMISLPLIGWMNNMIAIVMVIFFVCFFGFALLDNLLGLLIRLVYRHKIPYELVVNAENYQVFADLDVEGLSEQEISDKKKALGEELCTQALELERQGARKKVKDMLRQAALAGDVPAMGHYARHCIIKLEREAAVYWLECYIAATGSEDKQIRKAIRRLKHRRPVAAKFLAD